MACPAIGSLDGGDDPPPVATAGTGPLQNLSGARARPRRRALLGQPVSGAADAGRLHPVSKTQHRAAGTVCADAQVTTLRERLLKLAGWVERSVRRIVLHLPTSFPWLPTRQHLARAVGATS